MLLVADVAVLGQEGPTPLLVGVCLCSVGILMSCLLHTCEHAQCCLAAAALLQHSVRFHVSEPLRAAAQSSS